MLCPGVVSGSYERDARINFGEGSFEWKLKALVHFIRLKIDRKANAPPALHVFGFIGWIEPSDKNLKLMFQRGLV